MATLQAPLTIISPSAGGGGRPFQPPAATWFDEDPLHFVALEARPPARGDVSVHDGDTAARGSVISSVGSIDASSSTSAAGVEGGAEGGANGSEMVRYQAFALPKPKHRGQSDAKDDALYKQPLSAFDAAKQAAQDSLKTLATEISVSFPLPTQLANIENTRSVEDDDETYATEATATLSRRIPILAKFSPKVGNLRFLALQWTPTNVRIVCVEGAEEAPPPAPRATRRASFSARGLPGSADAEEAGFHLHWTIDLSYDALPVASKPERLPSFREGSARNLFGKGPRVEEGIVPGSTTIVGGGVLWCDRGEKEEKTELDLILVTTTAVLVYNVNVVKRQLVKAQVLPHDPAASFWYEPRTKTLVVGSYKSNLPPGSSLEDSEPNIGESLKSPSIDDSYRAPSRQRVSFPSAVMSMKTLFFSEGSAAVETFPAFVVGALREVESRSVEEDDHELALSLETFDSEKLGELRKEDAESAVVLPAEICLVNLYGSVYCIEVGSLGSGRGLGFTKLDREEGCIHVRQKSFEALKGRKSDIESTVSVGVIDNLVCIFAKKEETTYFIDVADLFADDSRLCRESIDDFAPEIHNDSLSFLAPSYFLDTSGQGLLYEVALSLSRLLQRVPPTACIIPFLLRRNEAVSTIRLHVKERFSTLIDRQDMDSLRQWLGVIVDQYSMCEAAMHFDSESTTLLEKASLVSLEGMAGLDDTSLFHQAEVPTSCRKVLTQAEMICILLTHVVWAIEQGDLDKLGFMSSLVAHYSVELERKVVTPCVAMQCLVVALLWRTGQSSELNAFLLAQQTRWTITRRQRQLNLATSGKMYFDNPGAKAYAETLFRIATEEIADNAPITRQLISYATIILVGLGATSLAIKCLLSAGHLNDAINVGGKKLRSSKSEADTAKLAEGTQSKDFWRAAVSHAKKLPRVSQRCQSFYLLHNFLQQWDPSAFALESRKIRVSMRGASSEQRVRRSFRSGEEFDTMEVEQSVLAHECPRFPDELFGGKESASCRRLRGMFGYVK